jgi:Putative transposase
VPRPRTGAVAFVQRFGSALQLTPHFHVLLPESVFEEVGEGTTTLLPLPSPTDDEVERMAATVARRVLATLRARGVLEQSPAPEEAFELARPTPHLNRVKRPARGRT